jgi:hypothetical protein
VRGNGPRTPVPHGLARAAVGSRSPKRRKRAGSAINFLKEGLRKISIALTRPPASWRSSGFFKSLFAMGSLFSVLLF